MLGRLASTTQRSLSTKMASTVPEFKPFTIALIQLGNVTGNKEHNLQHAREMIARAAKGQDGKKPHLIVLPVSEQDTQMHVHLFWIIGVLQFTLRF